MASRALWKGQLRLSLVSIPVEIHSARKTNSRISFRQIHGPSGKPVHYEKVVKGVGPVSADEILKGYETDKDDYILIDPEEINAIKLETRKTLELVQFVGACEIAPIWFDRPYYIVPTDELAEDAYRVVRDALRQAEKIGLGQLTMRGKEYLCAIRACGDGLLLETLHYEDEIRNADPMFSEIADEAVDDELLSVATQLIDRKTAKFDPGQFKDNYAEALRDLVEAKRKSKKTPRAAKSGDGGGGEAENVVDLMSALKKSLDSSKKGASSGSTGSKGGARTTRSKSSSTATKPSSSSSNSASSRKKKA